MVAGRAMIDPECNKNVFQLWKEGGEKLPFKVIRWTWNPATSTFLVERIEIGKWPYGKAWGRFTAMARPKRRNTLAVLAHINGRWSSERRS